MNETDVEIVLGDWFKKHRVPYWHNRAINQIENTNVFTTKGINKKPDIIIHTKKQPLQGYIALEIKNGNKAKNLYDSTKIITKYIKHYQDKETEYFINDKPIEIKAFVVATQYSKEGYLLRDEEKMQQPNDQWRKQLSEEGIHPSFEYNRTHQFVRQLWGFWRQSGRTPETPGVGVLLSGVLENYKPVPAVFFQSYFNDRWNVRWKEI